MTREEISMLTDLLEHEIFYAEGVVNAFDTEESNRSLNDLKAILETLRKPAGRVDSDLSKGQKDILLNLIKRPQLEVRRVLLKQGQIEKIRRDADILNKLEKSLLGV